MPAGPKRATSFLDPTLARQPLDRGRRGSGEASIALSVVRIPRSARCGKTRGGRKLTSTARSLTRRPVYVSRPREKVRYALGRLMSGAEPTVAYEQ